MKTKQIWVFAVAIACAASWSLCAWAADTPAAPGTPAPAVQAPTTPPAAPAAAPANATPAAKGKVRSEVKCVVTGKFEEKKIAKKDGKEGIVYDIVVATAKADDGKALDELKGKTLRVARKAKIKLADFAGKDVTISGTLVNNKRLEAASIK